MREKVEIIAEVGSNHGFDLDLARKYIVTAEKQGADVVKFQSIRKEKLFSQKILKSQGAGCFLAMVPLRFRIFMKFHTFP